MNRKAITYIIIISLLGLGIIVFSTIQYSVQLMNASDIQQEIVQMLVLFVLGALCRSLPVYIENDRSLDASIIIIYAALLQKGVYAGVLILVFSCIFTIEKMGDGSYSHILNIPPYKSIFNISNFTVSFFLPGQLFLLLGGEVGHIQFPGVLLPSLVFLFMTFLINSSILMELIALLHDQPFFKMWRENAWSLLPNVFALAPLGYFIALFFQNRDGAFLVFLFFVPLLFARYAFKLYLDSKRQYYNTIKTLTAAIEAKDKYTEGHSRRVESYAEQIAKGMGLASSKIESIKVAALLHDIGKIGIEDAILKKPSCLDHDEWAKIREHPRIGVKILEDVSFSNNIKNCILLHHEKFDGTGYPNGIQGSEIPLEAAILAVADAYDAMVSDRPYRKAFTREKAMSILQQDAGTHFHPKVVDSFLKIKEHI